MEDVKTPSQVAKELDISPSTLRKYSLLLEENGIEFKRNAKNSRQFTSQDVITLQNFITLIKTDGMTVEDAASIIANNIPNRNKTDENSDMHNAVERHDSDMAANVPAMLTKELKELQDVIKAQQETIDEFRKSQEERDAYFIEILEELQGEIKELQKQKELPQPKIEDTQQEEPKKKKGFFSRLFK